MTDGRPDAADQARIPTEWALKPKHPDAAPETDAVQVVRACIPANWPGGSHEHR